MSRYDPFRYKRSREDGIILRRGPRFAESGKQYNPVIRRIIAGHRRELQPLIDRCIRLGGRYCKELAGWKETRLDENTVVRTFINPFGLAPHLESRIIDWATAPSVPVETSLIFQSGLHLYIDEDTDYICAGPNLITYFSGNGDTFSFATGHIQGEVVVPLVNGFGEVPVLDASNRYSSQATDNAIESWVGDYDRRAHRYTGLMRLCYQSREAWSNPAALRPSGWPAWTRRYYGILRYDSGTTVTYWLVYLGPLGCRVAQLTVPEDTAFATFLGELTEPTSNDAEKLHAEMAVMRGLQKTTNTFELLTEAQMTTAIGSGFGPLGEGGYHFSPQLWGSTSETQTAAVAVFRKGALDGSGDYYLATKQITAEFGFSDPGDPNLTLTVAAEEQVTPKEVWHYDYTTNQYKNALGVREGDELIADSTGSIYALYQNDGPLFITYDGTTNELNKPAAKGCSSLDVYWVGNGGQKVTARTGSGSGQEFYVDFSLEGANVEYFHNQSNYTNLKRSAYSVATGDIDQIYCNNNIGPDFVSAGRVSGVPVAQGCGTTQQDPNLTCCGTIPVTLNKARVFNTTSRIRTIASLSWGGACLLISNDPTVIYAASGVRNKLSQDSIITTYSITTAHSFDHPGNADSCVGPINGQMVHHIQNSGAGYCNVPEGTTGGQAQGTNVEGGYTTIFNTWNTNIFTGSLVSVIRGDALDNYFDIDVIMHTTAGKHVEIGVEDFDPDYGDGIDNLFIDNWVKLIAPGIFAGLQPARRNRFGPRAMADYTGKYVVYQQHSTSEYASAVPGVLESQPEPYDKTTVEAATEFRFVGFGDSL